MTRVRDYVDLLQEILEEDDHINKGEADGEDLSNFKDSTIASKLRDKIYDSSITIVIISPNLKETCNPEDDQWIPWEISYSLKEHTRNCRTSQTNALLAVVLPDRSGSYRYFVEQKTCCSECCTKWHTEKLFKILKENMFNALSPEKRICSNDEVVFYEDHSYIHSVKWEDFKNHPNYYLEVAINCNENISDYDITKKVD